MIGAVSAAIAVALGALGAHGLQGWLDQTFPPEIASKRMQNWQTAADYHRFHSLGMIVVGMLLHRSKSKWINTAGCLMLLGILLFSGLLYVYSVTGSKWMGPIFPIGGLSYIIAWLLLGVGATKQSKIETSETQSRT